MTIIQLDICQKLFVSLRNLIKILASNSLSSDLSETQTVEENLLEEDEQTLSLVQPVQEIETTSLEIDNENDHDTALSSFSKEVIEVINEEEEKVA